MKTIIKWGLISAGIIIGGLVIFAFARTLNKTELEFLIHINEELVQQSVFGESPTFAIWLEDPDNGQTYTAYATRRVATGDWEGKADVPVALPLWSEINKAERKNRSSEAGMAYDEIYPQGQPPCRDISGQGSGLSPAANGYAGLNITSPVISMRPTRNLILRPMSRMNMPVVSQP